MLRRIAAPWIAAVTLIFAMGGVAPASHAQEVIEFDPEYILGFPEGSDEWKLLGRYARELAERQHRTGTVMLAALDNFETTMSFPSSTEATPKVAAAMLETVFKESISMATKKVDEALFAKLPVASTLTKVLTAASEEIDRAAKAQSSHKVGAWIRDQRRIISDTVVGGGDTSAKIEKELGDAFRQLDEAERMDVIYLVDVDLERLQATPIPSQAQIERGIYESWINAHWNGMRGHDGSKTSGVIDIRWEIEEEDGMVVFDGDERTTWVSAPFGDKLVDGMREVMNELSSVKSPLDFRVNKRVCFWGENLVGGTSWSCGWVDKNNKVKSTPHLPLASKAMGSNVWRMKSSSFKN